MSSKPVRVIPRRIPRKGDAGQAPSGPVRRVPPSAPAANVFRPRSPVEAPPTEKREIRPRSPVEAPPAATNEFLSPPEEEVLSEDSESEVDEDYDVEDDLADDDDAVEDDFDDDAVEDEPTTTTDESADVFVTARPRGPVRKADERPAPVRRIDEPLYGGSPQPVREIRRSAPAEVDYSEEGKNFLSKTMPLINPLLEAHGYEIDPANVADDDVKGLILVLAEVHRMRNTPLLATRFPLDEFYAAMRGQNFAEVLKNKSQAIWDENDYTSENFLGLCMVAFLETMRTDAGFLGAFVAKLAPYSLNRACDETLGILGLHVIDHYVNTPDASEFNMEVIGKYTAGYRKTDVAFAAYQRGHRAVFEWCFGELRGDKWLISFDQLRDFTKKFDRVQPFVLDGLAKPATEAPRRPVKAAPKAPSKPTKPAPKARSGGSTRSPKGHFSEKIEHDTDEFTADELKEKMSRYKTPIDVDFDDYFYMGPENCLAILQSEYTTVARDLHPLIAKWNKRGGGQIKGVGAKNKESKAIILTNMIHGM